MKKIKLFIFLTMILSMTLIIAGCKNKGFGFKSQEEIVRKQRCRKLMTDGGAAGESPSRVTG